MNKKIAGFKKFKRENKEVPKSRKQKNDEKFRSLADTRGNEITAR